MREGREGRVGKEGLREAARRCFSCCCRDSRAESDRREGLDSRIWVRGGGYSSYFTCYKTNSWVDIATWERNAGWRLFSSNCSGCSCWKLVCSRFCCRGKNLEVRRGEADGRRGEPNALAALGWSTGTCSLGGIRIPEWWAGVGGANTENCSVL